MMQLALLAAFVLAPVAVVYAWSWCAVRLAQDADIDRLIAQNAAKPREGMGEIDWLKANRSGARTWQQALRAQRRWSTVVAPPSGREGRVN